MKTTTTHTVCIEFQGAFYDVECEFEYFNINEGISDTIKMDVKLLDWRIDQETLMLNISDEDFNAFEDKITERLIEHTNLALRYK